MSKDVENIFNKYVIDDADQQDESDDIFNRYSEGFLPKAGPIAKDVGQGVVNVGGSVLSGARDFGYGLGQGATMGFGDEIVGAVEAAKESAEEGSFEDFYNKYRQHQKENEALMEEAKARSPWLYGAGNLAGGVGAAIAMPVGGLAKGSTMLARAGYGALEGAGYGALMGAGESKSTIEDPNRLAEDIASGGIMGGVTGGIATPVFGKVGDVVSSSVQKLNKTSPLFRQLVTLPYESGVARGAMKEGEIPLLASGEVAPKYGSHTYWRDNIQNLPQNEANDIIQNLENSQKHIQDQYGNVLKQADTLGVGWTRNELFADPSKRLTTLNFIRSLSAYKPKLLESDPVVQKLLTNQPINASEMQTLKELSSSLYKELDNKNYLFNPNENFQENFLQFNKLAKDELGNKIISDTNEPIYKLINEKYGDYNKLMYNTVNADVPIVLRDKYPEKLTDTQMAEFGKTLSDYAAKTRGSEAIHIKTQKSGDELLNQVSNILKKEEAFKNDLGNYSQAYDPKSFSKNIQSPNELRTKLQNLSDIYQSVARNRGLTHREGGLAGPKGIIGETLSFGAKHGQSNIYRIGKVAGWTDDALLRMTNKLSNVPVIKHQLDALRTALLNKNIALKNATIFTLIQKPEFRQALENDEEFANLE